MVTDDGLTPEPVIVIVAPIVPTLPVLREITVTGDGPVEGPLLPPQDVVTSSAPSDTTPMADARTTGEKPDRMLSMGQKNFLEMLKPMNQELLSTLPRAIWPSVVPIPFEKLT